MSYSYDDVYVLHAWRDNRRRLVLTQGEGYSGAITDNDVIKAPRFQLRDERGAITIPSSGNPSVQLAVTRSNRTEDLLACVIEDNENGIVYCPITKSLTDIAGEVKGEIRLITGNAVTKFYGVDFYVFNGVSDSAIAQSSPFSALVQALQQVNAIITGGSEGTISLDTVIQHNGIKPVSSGIIYDYLTNDFQTYLQDRFTKIKYAHEVHSSSYDAETNPVDDYGAETLEGVYIDNATELGTYYIIKNMNGARVGVLLCASVFNPGTNYGKTQIALYYSGNFKYRHQHSGSGGSWDEWTSIELQKNKDLYNVNDETYFGISNDDAKYPSAKAVYKFIQANIQAIKSSVLLGFDSLTIDKEYNIHKDLVETYLNNSDYTNDPGYSTSALDGFSFGSETHGRPNKIAVSIPSGGTTITFRDTISGRQWSEATESTTYIQNLIPNRIYVYRILDANGSVLQTGTAKANGKIRMINAGGDTYNIRDIGGWAADGGTLKYGVVYRGGELNSGISITSAQQAFFRDALGVRDEIDLRGSGFGSTALGIGVDYINIPFPYAPNIFNESHFSENAAVIKRIAYDIANNRPIYIHCQAGADRTATICLYLEAICGVSQNDIDRDYELTSFSKEPANNWSNRILRKRNSIANYHLKNIVSVINTMEGTSFNDRVIRFLLRTGVSIDELNTIRFGLIDGNPTKLSNPYSSVTVTNVLTNVSTTNASSSVTKYQPYKAELKVNNMCTFISVAITMGGVDAIQYYENGKIDIPIVTGDLVINAEASQSSIITKGMISDESIEVNNLSNDLKSILAVTTTTSRNLIKCGMTIGKLNIEGAVPLNDVTNCMRTAGFVPILPQTYYTFSRKEAGTSVAIYFYDSKIDGDAQTMMDNSNIINFKTNKNLTFQTPAGAKYLRFYTTNTDTTMQYQIELGSIATEYQDPNFEKSEMKISATSMTPDTEERLAYIMNHLYVSSLYPAESEDNIHFKTLSAANDSIKDNNERNRYTIHVANGTYTDLEEYYANAGKTTENPEDYIPEDDEIGGTDYRGIICKDYVYYEGNIQNPSQCVIKWYGETGRDGNFLYTKVSKRAPFHLSKIQGNSLHTHIKGFMFDCRNLRYCLHIETSGAGREVDWLIEQCIFNWGGNPNCLDENGNPFGNNGIGVKPALGCGHSPLERGTFRNCIISSKSGVAYFNHDGSNGTTRKTGVLNGADIHFENCIFNNGKIQCTSNKKETDGDDQPFTWEQTVNRVWLDSCESVGNIEYYVKSPATTNHWRIRTIADDNISSNQLYFS